MTVMLLALMFSDSALTASEVSGYRVLEDARAEPLEPRVPASSRTRSWTPGLESWTLEKKDCPAFFSRNLAGFGTLRAGPSCTAEEIPYAL